MGTKTVSTRDTKVYNDLKVNGGFPEGMTLADFKPGAVVTVRWNDVPDTNYIILETDQHAHNYKRERGFRAVDRTLNGWARISHTQIVAFHGPVDQQLINQIFGEPT